MHSRARKTITTVLLAAGLSVGAVAVATPASAESASTSGGDWNVAANDSLNGRATTESINDTGMYTTWVFSYPDRFDASFRYYESYRVNDVTREYRYNGSVRQRILDDRPPTHQF